MGRKMGQTPLARDKASSGGTANFVTGKQLAPKGFPPHAIMRRYFVVNPGNPVRMVGSEEK